MDPFTQCLLIDVPVVITCIILLVVVGHLRFSHPAFPYLIFHIYTVTVRLWGLSSGADTLFGGWRFHGVFLPVDADEITRAALYFDFALLAMTAVWLLFRKPTNLPDEARRASMPLRTGLVWAVVVTSFPLGIFGLAFYARLPGISTGEAQAQFGDWSTSSWLYNLMTWCGLALLAYIYHFGLRKIAVWMLIIYIGVIAIQGYARVRAIVPSIMLVQIWLDRNNRRWPRAWVALVGVACLAVFIPLKSLGMMIQRGESSAAIGQTIERSVGDASSARTDDQTLLDQAASALTLVDRKGEYLWGRQYLNLITLPIPRPLWPDKPGLADFLFDMSTRGRPMAGNGMIVTYLGEAYASFGIVGVFLMPALLAYGLLKFYQKAYAVRFNTVMHFSYTLLSVNLIQVYRDGLISMFLFPFVHMMPLAILVLLHLGRQWVMRDKVVVAPAEPRLSPQAQP